MTKSLVFIINKYLKYKLKYLKKKNPSGQFNKIIETEKYHLINSTNTDYSMIYRKYIKYKNKYISMKKL